MTSPTATGATLRPATVTDIDGLVAVHVASREAAYRDHMAPAYLNRFTVEQRRERWRQQLSGADPAAVTWVAERDRRVVGFCHASLTHAPTGAPHFHSLYVLPGEQGGGLGRALLGATARSLAAMGFRHATLHVFDFNAPAIVFYERLGWRREATEPVPDAGDPPVSVHRYGLALAPESTPAG